MNTDDLIKEAIKAMKKAQDVKVNGNNLDICIVGKGDECKLLTSTQIENYLNEIDNKMEIS